MSCNSRCLKRFREFLHSDSLMSKLISCRAMEVNVSFGWWGNSEEIIPDKPRYSKPKRFPFCVADSYNLSIQDRARISVALCFSNRSVVSNIVPITDFLEKVAIRSPEAGVGMAVGIIGENIEVNNGYNTGISERNITKYDMNSIINMSRRNLRKNK